MAALLLNLNSDMVWSWLASTTWSRSCYWREQRAHSQPMVSPCQTLRYLCRCIQGCSSPSLSSEQFDVRSMCQTGHVYRRDLGRLHNCHDHLVHHQQTRWYSPAKISDHHSVATGSQPPSADQARVGNSCMSVSAVPVKFTSVWPAAQTVLSPFPAAGWCHMHV